MPADSLFQDLRYGLRLLARSPGFTAAAVLTLAVALGANTVVFSVLDGVLLRALPYPEPDRIMDVGLLLPPSEGRPSREEHLTSEELLAVQRGARSLERLAAYRTGGLTLNAPGGAEHVTGAAVSAALWPLLRAVPIQGTCFREEAGQAGREPVVILGDGLWRGRFGASPRAVGSTVMLDGVAHRVIGVMPREFSFPAAGVQLWTPLSLESPAAVQRPDAGSVAVENYAAVARLRAGVSREQAEAEAEGIVRGLPLGQEGEGAPAGGPSPGRVRLAPLRDEMVAGVRPGILAMSAAVALVVVMACINLANLLLARSSARRREMAIRSALGGSRRRLVRQVLTESALLSLAGGLAGLLVAGLAHRALPGVLPRDIPRLGEVHLDARVFLFALAVSGVAGLLSGLVPALRSSGTDLVAPLRGGATEGPAGLRWQGVFVVAEVALAFVLLAGAGLLLRSFERLLSVAPGYEAEHVLSATVDLDPGRYGSPASVEAFFDALLDRITRSPGVEAAGVASVAPLGAGFSLHSVEVVGQRHGGTLAVVQLSSPGYLAAMGLRLARGRWLTRDDQTARLPVAVVNETLDRRCFAGQALGRQVRVGAVVFEIVGVIRDVHLFGLAAAPKPELFTSYHFLGQAGPSRGRLTVAVRTAGAPLALAPLLRAALRELDPTLAPADLGPMTVRFADSVAQPRFYALLLGAFAGLALLLAAAGVFGVLSSSVARDTRAIGVRRAVGAPSSAILLGVAGRGLALVAGGLAIGTAVALATTRVLGHLLFAVTTRDPGSFAAAAVTLVVVGLAACWQPARRALRVEPVEALRYDR